jgi:hypothetical protein
MRTLAADGKSPEIVNVETSLARVLIRAGILVEAPPPTPRLPHEQLIDEQGVRHERALPDEFQMSIQEHKDGAPYLQAQSSRAKHFFSGPDPATDPSGMNWPANLVADYRGRWKAYRQRVSLQ